MSGGLDWGPFGTNIPKAERGASSRTRSRASCARHTFSHANLLLALNFRLVYIPRLYTRVCTLTLSPLPVRGSAYASSPPAVRAFKFIPGPILQGRAWRRGPIINNNVTGSLARPADKWRRIGKFAMLDLLSPLGGIGFPRFFPFFLPSLPFETRRVTRLIRSHSRFEIRQGGKGVRRKERGREGERSGCPRRT